MDENMKRLGLEAGAVLSNNAGGFVYSIKNSQGNSALDQGFSDALAGLNLGGNAKWVKTLVYDLLSVGAVELTSKGDSTVKVGGSYVGEFLKGLGTSTVAADPIYRTPNAGGRTTALSTQPPAPIRQVPLAIM